VLHDHAIPGSGLGRLWPDDGDEVDVERGGLVAAKDVATHFQHADLAARACALVLGAVGAVVLGDLATQQSVALDERALASVARRFGQDQARAVTQRVAEVRDIERDRRADRELLAVAERVQTTGEDDPAPEVRAQAAAQRCACRDRRELSRARAAVPDHIDPAAILRDAAVRTLTADHDQVATARARMMCVYDEVDETGIELARQPRRIG
jgi:hypothetical protein